jgi:hypothetical protein
VTDPEALAAAIVRLADEQQILRVKGHVAVAGQADADAGAGRGRPGADAV